MKKVITIGVLSQFLNSSYHTVILDGIHRSVQKVGGRSIAIQTHRTEKQEYVTPLAFDQVDGWIVLVDAINSEFLERLKETGKPIVYISSNADKNETTVIRTDNLNGTYAAVTHLIKEHNHKQIAFTGWLENQDVYSRFLGYKKALEENNIPLNPSLVFSVKDNIKKYGRKSAQKIMKKGIEFTAIIGGCDATAIGLMEQFQQGGIRIPEDIAVVGFDDLPHARTCNPPLTTVHAPLEEIANAAVVKVLEQLEEDVPFTNVYVSPNLAIRKSCGCKHEMIEDDFDRVNTIRHLENIIQVNMDISEKLIKANLEEIKSLEWLNSTNIKWGCLGLWSREDQKNELVVEQVYNNPDDIVSPLNQTFRVEDFPPVSALLDSSFTNVNDIVTLHPIRTETRDWGVLALIGPVDRIGLWYDYSGTMTHSFNILASAIEREAMNEEKKEQENRYRQTAEQLEIVSRTVNDGVWEINILTQTIKWNSRFNNILNIEKNISEAPITYILDKISPEGVDKIHRLWDVLISENNNTFEIEYQAKKGSSYIWLYCVGEIVFGEDGNPKRVVGSIRDITERKEKEEQISFLAYHDPLTGLVNRSYFYEQLESALHEAKESKEKLAVLLLDLDRFKNINDTFGHQMGDQLLCDVTDKIKRVTSENVTISRLGGDEFIFLLPTFQNDQDVYDLGDNILQVLQKPFAIESYEVIVTGSLGISIYPNDGKDANTLIKSADIAMYRAKNDGGDQYELFAPTMKDLVYDRVTIENYLRKAIKHNQFKLYYQPQVNLETGKLTGLEALIRWDSPELGLISPQQFIPLAEETGLIIPIGNWVVQEACSQMRKWKDKGYNPIQMSVNISGRQFKQVDFAERILEELRKANIDPQLLCLEITESVAIGDIEYSIKTLEELKSFGVKVSLDDFGTGFSSLMLLKRLPLNMVKIDKVFINDMVLDNDVAAIVKAIIDMSHSIRLKNVAEGVETTKQLNQLLEQGCDMYQGYLKSKPLPAKQIEQSLLEVECSPA
ncbi:EAL domain-containing protein [Bacillus alkalicellulosilyticus]|uniref:EAL domain-containing protein n=1 Tax=Alkalihalobacterium alkalicellulosilyticum TaxID=1912214 RepID=UPI000996B9C0|nr:EAL domain-containing protein [Bacillus alkalicellulosilyticus]